MIVMILQEQYIVETNLVMNNWIIIGASSKGQIHNECQDSYIFKKLDNDLVICIVADGAGSKKNSKLGSSIVTKYGLRIIKNYLYENDFTQISKEKWQEESLKIIKILRNILEKYAIKKDMDFHSLGSTLIINIFNNKKLLSLHVGDGRAGYCNNKNDWKSSIIPFKGEEVGQTVFVTTSYIFDDEIYINADMIEDELKSVVLLTDGLENSTYYCTQKDKLGNNYDKNIPSSDFYNPMIEYIVEHRDKDFLQDDIEKFLKNGTPLILAEQDDKTLILATYLDV